MKLLTRTTRDNVDEPAPASNESWFAPLLQPPIPFGERACCCPAQAAYAVLVAPRDGRPQLPAVLLCAHHRWVARGRLAGRDIAVYDAAGVLVDSTLDCTTPVAAVHSGVG